MNVDDTITAVVPLPKTREALLKQRVTDRRRTLNDYVDEIHVELWETNTEYMRLLDAVDDAGTVEGSMSIDTVRAAEIIRAHAKKNGIAYAAEQRLASLVRSLNVVLKRYRMSRKERAVTVGGEIVPNSFGAEAA